MPPLPATVTHGDPANPHAADQDQVLGPSGTGPPSLIDRETDEPPYCAVGLGRFAIILARLPQGRANSAVRILLENEITRNRPRARRAGDRTRPSTDKGVDLST